MRLGQHERGRGIGARGEPEVAGAGPVALVVGVGAGKARKGVGAAEDAGGKVGELGAERIGAIIEVLEQVAYEEIEVHAREALAERGRGRGIAQHARERGVVAGVDKALLRTDAGLGEHVAHAVGIGKGGRAPDLARDARQGLDLLAQGTGRYHQVGARGVRVGLRHDLGREAQEAELAGNEVVELVGRVRGGGELLEQAAEHRHVGDLVCRHAVEAEVLQRVGKTVGGDVVAQARDGRAGVDHERRLGARLADVGHAQAGERGLVLGRVLGLLGRAQAGALGVDLAQLIGTQRGELGGELVLLGDLAVLGRLGSGRDRHELHERVVVALERELAQQVLKVRARKLLAEFRVDGTVLERERCRVVVIEPGRERIAGDRHAVGHAVVALAQVVLVAADHGLEALARDARLAELAAHVLHDLAELLRGALARVLQDDQLIGLQALGRGVARHVAADAGREDRLFERRLVGAEQRLEQDIGRDGALAVERAADHVAQAHLGVLGRGLHLDRGMLAHHGRLHGERVGGEIALLCAGGACLLELLGRRVALREELLVEVRERPLDIEVSVERDVAVGQVVVARVRVQELLVAELGDPARVAAAFLRVGGVRKELRAHAVVEHAHGVGERALHLVEDHAVVAQARGLARLVPVELEMPPLLLEDGLLGVDGGVQHRVHVHVHEVVEVLLVGGGHRVDRLVGVGHGVQERLHGALDEVHERLLDGVALRPAEHRVLEDMEDAGGVGGRRLKGDGKGLVLVAAGKIEQAGARGRVPEHIGAGVELVHLLAALDGKAMELGAGLEQGIRYGAGIGHGSLLGVSSQTALSIPMASACAVFESGRVRRHRASSEPVADGARWRIRAVPLLARSDPPPAAPRTPGARVLQ